METQDEILLDDGIATEMPIPELPELEQMPAPEASSAGYSTDIFTQEEFYEAFKATFYAAGLATKTKSLAIRPEEEVGARLSADKLYQIGLSSPYFRWLIEKGGWLRDAMVIGTFVACKADAVMQEKTGKGFKDIITRKIKAWRSRNRPTLKTRFASVFSGHQAPAKATEPAKS